jgi:hypothetical protein
MLELAPAHRPLLVDARGALRKNVAFLQRQLFFTISDN